MRSHVRDEFDDRYLFTLGTKVTLKRVKITNVPGHASIGLDMTVWDILDRPASSRWLLATYGHGTSGVLAVADMTRRKTLEDLGGWIEDVENLVGEVPVVVIGANRDAADQREVSEDEVRRLAESYGGTCFFASVNSNQPVEEAFMVLAERIASRRYREG